ncbi:MAG TPA: hypothetical protein VFU56_00280 [Gaiellaceae bacterium]|nr:hypothetical protein [Gaiellaceae bacterium]
MISTAVREQPAATQADFRVTLLWSLAAGSFLWWLLILGAERLIL